MVGPHDIKGAEGGHMSDLDDVEFDDGVTVTDPDQDALGYVYETHDDYLHGEDPAELEPDHDDDAHNDDAHNDDAYDDHFDGLGDEDF
ncbi:hypothetical protein UK82_07595 [Frankia sp. ACN1ag]|nr:hypothetical protein UK82_07595 [Frankia sp. ACN1ag]